jgi:hypothetical protein
MKPVEYRVSHRPSAIKNKWPERMKVADGK